MSDVGEVLAGAVIGYLIGTFPSADLVTRVATRGSVDIRHAGSGNPGGLNAMRVLGRTAGVVVIVLDALKGAIAGFAGLAIGDAAAYAAGTAAIAGHVWPVWVRFRGGRGVATAGGSFASVFPPFFLIAGLFALVVTLVRRSPALTMILVCPVWVGAAGLWWAAGLPNWWGPEPAAGLLVYAVLGASMVLARFRPAVRSGADAE
jgi:glycerol-3-phosphate acyltransferase PlsY